MEKGALTDFFRSYLGKESLFLDKGALQPNYLPEKILHRGDQLKQLANILAPCLKLQKPSNLFCYGKTGTGKTATIRYLVNQLINTANKDKIPLMSIYVNCRLKRIADTEYRLIAQLTRELGKEIPITGLPTDEVYRVFFNTIDAENQFVLIILDEIDQLIKKTGDNIIYTLVRINEDLKNSQISLIGISNDLLFVDNLDPRVKSSLCGEDLVFPPYNALQIRDILSERAGRAFRADVIENGVIEKCSAYAAREHGDARRAIELLRVAAEISERDNLDQIRIDQIDRAEEKIEHDHVLDIIANQPKQFQLTLYSIISISSTSNGPVFTGEVYELYHQLCDRVNLRPLTQRRVSDIIAEQDMLGIINTKVLSKGRYGRTRDISLTINPSTLLSVKKILGEGLELS